MGLKIEERWGKEEFAEEEDRIVKINQEWWRNRWDEALIRSLKKAVKALDD
jgi:hypothetical protein